MPISNIQLRSARANLRLEQKDLHEALGIGGKPNFKI